MASKTGRLIAAAQLLKQMVYHDMSRAEKELGPTYCYMDSSLVPETDIYLDVEHVEKVPPDFKPFVEPHKHQVSQIYGIIGGLTVEVILEGERHEVSGPAGVFIPAGMMHTIRPLRGSGYLVTVLRQGRYE